MDSPWIRELHHNTTNGTGHCAECPAYHDGRSPMATPGIGNLRGDLMVLTTDPRHPFDWAAVDDWAEYNAEHTTPTMTNGGGSARLAELVDPIDDLTVDDIWLGNTLKCPPAADSSHLSRDAEFACCNHYLTAEIQAVDPQLIVGLGADACLRTLAVLGVKRSHVPVSEECGRIFDTTPPLIVSPHWRYGWLDRPTRDRWGADWRVNQPGLEPQYDSYRAAVQDAIRSIRD